MLIKIVKQTADEPNRDSMGSANDPSYPATTYEHWPGDHDLAGSDIFRFRSEGKIVENWDVLQVVPDSAENDHGMC